MCRVTPLEQGIPTIITCPRWIWRVLISRTAHSKGITQHKTLQKIKILNLFPMIPIGYHRKRNLNSPGTSLFKTPRPLLRRNSFWVRCPPDTLEMSTNALHRCMKICEEFYEYQPNYVCFLTLEDQKTQNQIKTMNWEIDKVVQSMVQYTIA
jgi:hypothetical protein